MIVLAVKCWRACTVPAYRLGQPLQLDNDICLHVKPDGCSDKNVLSFICQSRMLMYLNIM